MIFLTLRFAIPLQLLRFMIHFFNFFFSSELLKRVPYLYAVSYAYSPSYKIVFEDFLKNHHFVLWSIEESLSQNFE